MVSIEHNSVKDILPFDFDKSFAIKKKKASDQIPRDIRKILNEAERPTNLGNYEEARRLSRQALEWALRKRHKVVAAEAKLSLGIIHFEKDKNITEAISLLEECLEIFKQHGSLRLESFTLLQLGAIKIEEGKLDEAWSYVSRSLEIDKNSNELFSIAWDLHQLGWIEDHRGNLNEALQLYDQALSKFLTV